MADDCRSAVFIPVRSGEVQHGLLMIQALKPGTFPITRRQATQIDRESHRRRERDEKACWYPGAYVHSQNKPPVNDPEGTSS
jgi:hypothetical protein